MGVRRAASDQRQRPGRAVGESGAETRRGSTRRRTVRCSAGCCSGQGCGQSGAGAARAAVRQRTRTPDDGVGHPGCGGDRPGHAGGAALNIDHANWVFWTAFLSGEKGQAPKATGTEQEIAARQAMRSWMLAQEPLSDLSQTEGARQGQFQTSGGPALMRIRDITSQLAAEFGAAGDMKQLAGAN